MDENRRKLISVVCPCFNEEKNVEELYKRVRAVFDELGRYDWEMIYIDNCSTDGTVDALRKLASEDKRVRAIVNMRNFGPIRSGYHVLMQAHGDAAIYMVSDLQDPPELIPAFIENWEKGSLLVAGMKTQSEENPLMYAVRTTYYRMLNSVANVELIEHFCGFALYDRRVIDELRKIDDNYPYLRGLVSELGFPPTKVPFVQPQRKHGKSKLNLYDLYDLAMQGLTSHSIVPMRIATFTGFIMALICLLIALFYLVYKLIFWSWFSVGMAPLVIGMFGMFSIQLMFIGLLGEYIGASHRQLLGRPLIVERERINFDQPARTASGSTT